MAEKEFKAEFGKFYHKQFPEKTGCLVYGGAAFFSISVRRKAGAGCFCVVRMPQRRRLKPSIPSPDFPNVHADTRKAACTYGTKP
jgi:hypothetical protein